MNNKVVFDIETKNIFADVGENNPALLDISVVCIYDYGRDKYESFLEEDFGKLWPIIEKADVLIGYNSNHFDIPLLNKYYPGDLSKIKSEVLLVGTSSDELIPDAHARMTELAEIIPTSELALYNYGRHTFMITEKEEFRRIALDFLSAY